MATKKKSEVDETEMSVDVSVEEKDDDRVSVFIPYIEGEDPEVTIGINGVFTKIKKGRPVRVKRNIAMVLANSNSQTMAALENQEKFKSQRTDL